jgi:hypothetical protein
MKTKLLPLLLWLGLAVPVHAGDMTNAQVQQLYAQMGFQEGVAQISRKFVDQSETFKLLDTTKRDCIAGVVDELVADSTRQSLRTTFVSDEYAQAWLEFLQTPAGQNFAGVLKTTMQGGDAPSEEGFLAGLTPEQQQQMAEFMVSPAGMAFLNSPPSPKMEFSEEQELELGMQVMQRCQLTEADLD